MLRRLLLAVALGSFLVVFAAQCDNEEGESEPGVTLAVNPGGIAADGESMAEITITVTNYSGTVVMTTNRGMFTESQTSTLGIEVSGSVKTLIKSCREGFVEDCVGTASIKATADTALGFASLRFLSTGAGGAGGGGPTCESESICDNGVDEDGDGYVDCEDDDCCGDPVCLPGTGGAGGQGNDCTSYETDCTDGLDNDGDTLIDCADSNCCVDPTCAGGQGGAGGAGGGGGGGGDPDPGSCARLNPNAVYMYGHLSPTASSPAFSPVGSPRAPCVSFGDQLVTDFQARPSGSLVYLVPGHLGSPGFPSILSLFSAEPFLHPDGAAWSYPSFRVGDHPTLPAPGCTPGEPTRLFVGPADELIYQCNSEVDYWQDSPAQKLDTLGKELVAVGDGALLTRDGATSRYYLLTGDWFDGSASETTLTLPAGVPANAEILAVRPNGPASFWIVLAPNDGTGRAQRITFSTASVTLGGDYSAYPATHARYVDSEGDFGTPRFDFVPNAVLDGGGDLWEVGRALDIAGAATGPLAVLRRGLGAAAATELVYEDPAFDGTSSPPEIHLPVFKAIGLFTGATLGSGGGEGGSGGGGGSGGPVDDMNDCWTEPDGSPATRDIIKVTGTAGGLGALAFTAWGTAIGVSTATGSDISHDASQVEGTPSTISAVWLSMQAHEPIEVGRVYTGAPAVMNFRTNMGDGGIPVAGPCNGPWTGTFSYDRLLPVDPDNPEDGGHHGVYTFKCPDMNIDVHGCFRAL